MLVIFVDLEILASTDQSMNAICNGDGKATFTKLSTT